MLDEQHSVIRDTLKSFYGGKLPENFELHAGDSLNGEGFFADKGRADRNALVRSLLDVIANRGHGVHFVGIDKGKLAAAPPLANAPANAQAGATRALVINLNKPIRTCLTPKLAWKEIVTRDLAFGSSVNSVAL